MSLVYEPDLREGTGPMESICFVGTYPPTMCGIADYTSFLTREAPAGRWGVISFDRDECVGSQTTAARTGEGPVWCGIPGRREYSAAVIGEGLRALHLDEAATVLWFQHENGIWPNTGRFITMLRGLDLPRVVTFHSLHFQSRETPFGLHATQYRMLRSLLPNVDAITVFSRGVSRAVTSAFPEHAGKVHVLKHGVHSYPDISRLSRRKAKERLASYLLKEAGLDGETRGALHRERVFRDPDTVVLGQTGFLCPSKQSELLFRVRDALQELVPEKRVVAVRIGSPREESQKEYAGRLRSEQDRKGKFLLELWLPEGVLPLAQRAFDVNFYWPSMCTQSGVLAHALGAGAVVAGRRLEGVGETLKEAGQLTDARWKGLLVKIRELMLSPELAERAAERGLSYAASLSWGNQVRRHYQLASDTLHPQSHYPVGTPGGLAADPSVPAATA